MTPNNEVDGGCATDATTSQGRVETPQGEGTGAWTTLPPAERLQGTTRALVGAEARDTPCVGPAPPTRLVLGVTALTPRRRRSCVTAPSYAATGEEGRPMARTDAETLLPDLDSRDAYIEFLEEEAAGGTVSGSKLERPLIRSYLLETVREQTHLPDPAGSFAAATETQASQIDHGTYVLRSVDGVIAIMEGADTRFPVLHSTYKSDKMDALVNRGVRASAMFDHVWLAGAFFDELWQWTKTTCLPSRLAKLKFHFEGAYEDEEDAILEATEEGIDEDGNLSETRRSTFEVADHVDQLDATIGRLRRVHDPLYSTVRLRIPSSVRGGHEVWNDGKVTNRSISFSEQQKVIRFVSNIYESLTTGIEEEVWYGTISDDMGIRGKPVLLEFGHPLPASTLHEWAKRTFGSAKNRFRLGGKPIWSGSDRTRLHVYGIDRHVWQPILLEATRHHLLVVLPRGTCGNTVNRLVTNVQQQLSPKLTTWVGEFPYQEFLTRGDG